MAFRGTSKYLEDDIEYPEFKETESVPKKNNIIYKSEEELYKHLGIKTTK